MESLRDILAYSKNLISGLGTTASAAPQPITPPAAPSAEIMHEIIARVAAATAAIGDAHGHRATTFLVQRHGINFLVTNAHLTNNYSLQSTAFHLKGKKYFPIIKDTQIAFAEHLAFNPQGVVCSPNGHTSSNQAFRDTSILRIVSPEQTRDILYDLSFNEGAKERLQTVLRIIPGVISPQRVGKFTAEELLKITQDFHLQPLPDTNDTDVAATPDAYSMAYFMNAPLLIKSHVAKKSDSPNGIDLKLTRTKAIDAGHSGSPLFDIGSEGRLIKRGMVTQIVLKEPFAQATPYATITDGIDAVIGNKTVHLPNLSKVCATIPGESVWLNATAITPPPSARPQTASVTTTRP